MPTKNSTDSKKPPQSFRHAIRLQQSVLAGAESGSLSGWQNARRHGFIPTT